MTPAHAAQGKSTRSVVTASDCLTCGICCCSLYAQVGFCDLLKADIEKLDENFVKKNVVFPSFFDRIVYRDVPYAVIRVREVTQKRGILEGITMIMCAALRGTVMHKVKCSIYDKRPHACKTAVVPGDSTCRFLRIKVKEALEDEAKTKTG